MVATSAGSKPACTNKHNLSSLVSREEKCWYSEAETSFNSANWSGVQPPSQHEMSNTWNHETRQAILLLLKCSRGRSSRLWSLLHSYGRLQRWNVSPVNTEGRKSQPIWQELCMHTMNTHPPLKKNKCEITKHRRHQVLLCNVGKNKKRLVMHAKWGRNRLWVESNGCAISACIL